ncbi:MAG: hypothetical protein DIU78_012315 [Pseudomonadota bacterium]
MAALLTIDDMRAELPGRARPKGAGGTTAAQLEIEGSCVELPGRARPKGAE